MKKSISLYLLILFLVMACTSNDSEEIINANAKYLKSKIYTNLPSGAPNFDEFFEFDDNVLISASGRTQFIGDYTYNQNGYVTNRTSQGNSFSYEYDAQDRPVSETDASGNSVRLEYEGNTINIFETRNGETTPFSRLTTNGLGQIIEYRELRDMSSSYTFMVQKYVYDVNGNITEIRYEENNFGDPDTVLTYEYDNNANPYFESLKHLYRSIYYVKNRGGLQHYADRGLTPNNIMSVSRDGMVTTTYSYQYDNDGYAVQGSRSSQNSPTSEYVFDYQ